jgi:hypothetical protein
VEILVLAAVLIQAMWLVSVFGLRLMLADSQVDAATRDAARTASIAHSARDARTSAATAATATLAGASPHAERSRPLWTPSTSWRGEPPACRSTARYGSPTSASSACERRERSARAIWPRSTSSGEFPSGPPIPTGRRQEAEGSVTAYEPCWITWFSRSLACSLTRRLHALCVGRRGCRSDRGRRPTRRRRHQGHAPGRSARCRGTRPAGLAGGRW